MKLVDKEVPGGVRDFVGYGRTPPRIVWPNGAKLALNLAINYEEGSEASLPAGDGRNELLGEINYTTGPEYRDLAVESTYEFGSRAGVWRLLRLFDEYRIKVTFFACSVAVERNPEVGQAIRQAGHDVCSHGWRWEDHWRLSRDEERQHIAWAVDSFERTCGERPYGWYCRYGPSVNTRELLVEEGGFLYDADSYSDDIPFFRNVNGKSHLVVPYNSLPYNDIRYSLSQGMSSPADFVDVCVRGIDELRREGASGFPKMMSIGLHPRLSGQAGRASAVREIVEYALSKGDVWFARRLDIARWWLEHHEEFNEGDQTPIKSAAIER